MPQVDWWLALTDVHEDTRIAYWYDPRLYLCAVADVGRSADPPIEWRIEAKGGEVVGIEVGSISGRFLGIVVILTHGTVVRLARSLVHEGLTIVKGAPAFDISAWPRSANGGRANSPCDGGEFERIVQNCGQVSVGIDNGSVIFRLANGTPARLVVMDDKLYVGFDKDNRISYLELRLVEESIISSILTYFGTCPGWS